MEENITNDILAQVLIKVRDGAFGQLIKGSPLEEFINVMIKVGEDRIVLEKKCQEFEKARNSLKEDNKALRENLQKKDKQLTDLFDEVNDLNSQVTVMAEHNRKLKGRSLVERILNK